MSKHTPGPWNLHSELTDRESFVRKCRAVAIDEATGKILRIASTDISIDIPADEKKANARLISAAPTMLAVLRELQIEANEGRIDEYWKEILERVIEKATYEPNK